MKRLMYKPFHASIIDQALIGTKASGNLMPRSQHLNIKIALLAKDVLHNFIFDLAHITDSYFHGNVVARKPMPWIKSAWSKLKNLQAWHVKEVQPKANMVQDPKTDRIQIPFASFMDLDHLKHTEIAKHFRGTKDEWCSKVTNVTEECVFQAVLAEQRAPASQMAAASVGYRIQITCNGT